MERCINKLSIRTFGSMIQLRLIDFEIICMVKLIEFFAEVLSNLISSSRFAFHNFALSKVRGTWLDYIYV